MLIEKNIMNDVSVIHLFSSSPEISEVHIEKTNDVFSCHCELDLSSEAIQLIMLDF